ncbi:MAG: hypothetical protein ACK4R8_01570 [Thiobacillus sp.]
MPTRNLSKLFLLPTAIVLTAAASAADPLPRLRPAPACPPDSPATQALERILRAYERGDAMFLQERLAPDLPGLGRVFDAVTQRRLNARDTRVRVTERQTQCGPDVAIIDFAWEKRALVGATLTPRVERGRSAFLFSGLGQGLDGPWRLSGLSGDNFFLGGAGAAGVLRVNPASASYGTPSCTVTATVSASGPLVSPPTTTATIDAMGICSSTPLSFACDLTGTGFVPTSTATTAFPACAATTAFTPVPASGALAFTVAGSTLSVSGPPGASVPVAVPYTASAGPVPIGVWTVTGSAAGACATTITLTTGPLTCTPTPALVAALIEVYDPDLAGPSLAIQVTASNGDSETLNLTRAEAGRYRAVAVPVTRGATAVVPGNGRIDLVGPTPGTVILTLGYTDTEPGDGLPPQPRTASFSLTP